MTDGIVWARPLDTSQEPPWKRSTSTSTVHCRSCKLSIEETLEELDGVDDSDVDLPTRTVTVAYDPDTVELAAVTAAIEEAGYAVEH